jgi:putative toxin-antitoxin system antitoxin component (TIGR02293 family)
MVVAARFIAEILGLGASVRTMQELDTAVTDGLPKRSLVLLSSRLYRDHRAANAFKYKVIPAATWKRRAHEKRLSPQESERIERLARVLAYAEYVLDDQEDARQWMNAGHSELDEKTPLEAARTEIGARRVESVLNKLFFGLPA